MKRLLSLLAFVMICFAGAYSQAKWVTPELYFGVNGGATFATATMVPTYTSKTFLLGYNGGVTFRYITEKHFGIQAEINYNQAGWKDKYDYGSTEEYYRQVNSVELPFMLHAYFTTPKKVARFFINAGPQIGYIVSDKEYSANLVKSYPHYGKEITNKFQWGVGGGVGFEFHFLKRHVIGVVGHFNYYFSDYFPNALTDDFVTSSSMQITARAYYLFRIK